MGDANRKEKVTVEKHYRKSSGGKLLYYYFFSLVCVKEFIKYLKMEKNQVDQLIALYGNRLPVESLEMVKSKMLEMDYSVTSIKMAQFKDQTITLILSILIGSLGIDRIYIGDVGLGIAKLLTCGGASIWWIIDIFMISDATRRKNLESFMLY